MKSFYFLSFILLLLTGCKYGSYKEAFDACKAWKQKGGEYSYPGYERRRSYDIRSCRNEKITKRILGVEYTNVKAKYYSSDPFKFIPNTSRETTVIKRFKY